MSGTRPKSVRTAVARSAGWCTVTAGVPRRVVVRYRPICTVARYVAIGSVTA